VEQNSFDILIVQSVQLTLEELKNPVVGEAIGLNGMLRPFLSVAEGNVLQKPRSYDAVLKY
jgi:hypothetical protein